jgi:hypothetical protein
VAQGEISGPVSHAEKLGKELAVNLKSKGAGEILKEVLESNRRK